MPRKTKKIARPKTRVTVDDDPPVRSERELIRDLNEDLVDAWDKLRDFAAGLGEQRIYTSVTAIMFARRVCYMFVRPKKSYLQVNIILAKMIESDLIKRGNRLTESRAVNVFRLVHPDQVEAPLTDWIQSAFEFTKPD